MRDFEGLERILGEWSVPGAGYTRSEKKKKPRENSGPFLSSNYYMEVAPEGIRTPEYQYVNGCLFRQAPGTRWGLTPPHKRYIK